MANCRTKNSTQCVLPRSLAHARLRESPYSLVSITDALLTVLREVRPLPVYDEPVSILSAFCKVVLSDLTTIRTHQVTSKLRGYVIAEDVYAPQNVPITHSTNVDGYALRCESSTSVVFPQSLIELSQRPTLPGSTPSSPPAHTSSLLPSPLGASSASTRAGRSQRVQTQ